MNHYQKHLLLKELSNLLREDEENDDDLFNEICKTQSIHTDYYSIVQLMHFIIVKITGYKTSNQIKALTDTKEASYHNVLLYLIKPILQKNKLFNNKFREQYFQFQNLRAKADYSESFASSDDIYNSEVYYNYFLNKFKIVIKNESIEQ